MMAVMAGCADAKRGTGSTTPPPVEEPFQPAPAQDFEEPATGVVTEEETLGGHDVVNTRYSLEVVGGTDHFVNFSGRLGLEVRYLDPDGRPVRGGDVHFAFDGPSADLVLGPNTVTTSSTGSATATLEAGVVRGNYRVVVTAERARPVVINIDIQPKDRASYVVQSFYDGTFRPEIVSVRLLSEDIVCSDIDPFDLPEAIERFDVIPEADGAIPDVGFLALPNGTRYTAISVGVVGNDIPVAYGCNDEQPTITDGFDAEVQVVLDELRPNIEGEYDIVTRVDLLDALPEPWSTNLTLIGRLFSDPTDLIIDLLLGDPESTSDGFLGGSIIVDNPLLRQWVEAGLDSILDSIISDELQEVFDIGGAVYRVVSQFTLAGDLVVVAEPDENGLLASNNIHRYHTMTINWDVNCPDNAPEDCGKIDLSMSERLAEVGTFSGEFGGSVRTGQTGYFLEIDRHSMAFNYGALVLTLVEQIVFPEIFGPGINSVRAALENWIDCRGLADSVFDPAGPDLDPVLNAALYGACGEVLDALEDQVIGWAVSGNTNDLSNLTFGTHEIQQDADLATLGCPLSEPEMYSSTEEGRYFSYMGTEDDRCLWDTRLDTSGETRNIDGDFYSIRPE